MDLRHLFDRLMGGASLTSWLRERAGAAGPRNQLRPLEARLSRLEGQVHGLFVKLDEKFADINLGLSQVACPPASQWRGRLASEASPGLPPPVPLGSAICREADFHTPWYRAWCQRLGETPRFHRKQWELVYICQALHERGMLREGHRGLGFGVGREPLPALFASLGIRLVATDLPPEGQQAAGWMATHQHSSGLAFLRRDDLVAPEVLSSLVTFRALDMRSIPEELQGFDFCWSACALEHLGSISEGLRFVERSVDCLRPGGIAVHTTELNVSSNDDTLEQGSTVLFRRKDFEGLVERLTARGFRVAALDMTPGQGQVEGYIDLPPYRQEPHMRLAIQGHVSTSVGLIIER